MDSVGFARDETPYRNRDALLEDYTPESLVGRDEEVEEYQRLLQPVIWGDQPNNIFVYGKAGAGKTATTRFLLSRLKQDAEQYDDLTLTTTYVNCDGLESSYQVATRIVNQFRHPTNRLRETGYSKAEVYRKMWVELEKQTGLVLLVLDEIDHIRNDDGVLYQLSRGHEVANLEDTKIGVIGISNDLTFRDRLSAKVKSSLCERELSFSDYDANELSKVLKQRREVAFRDGAVDNGIISLCSAYAASETGDAREALNYLRTAGDLAREEGEEVVRESHVKHAKDAVERRMIANGLTDRGEQVQLVAYAVATFAVEEETPVRSTEIFDRYESLTEKSARDALSIRWVREHLDSLSMLGALSVEEINKGAGGGRYKQYELSHNVSLVLDALQETIEATGIHGSVLSYVE